MGEITKKEKLTQRERVLEVFREARRNGNQWVDGTVFVRMVPAILQSHTRVFELEALGFKFEKRFIADKNWKEYRLQYDPERDRPREQTTLFTLSQQRPAYGP